MTNRILFHTPTSLTGPMDSGSKVRPAMMYEAFQDLGYEVEHISGPAEERLRKFNEIKDAGGEYLFCYSEPSTWPLNPYVDYRLYCYLWKESIPTGIFYRDLYWKFPDLFEVTGLKRWELLFRYKADLLVFDNAASVLYFPSESFSSLIETKSRAEPLPPAGEDKHTRTRDLKEPYRAIYVGGVSHRYGTDLLAKAFQSLNRDHHLPLDLVCRESELKALPESTRERLRSPWVSIHHVSGKELEKVYENADFAINPLRTSEYNNAAMAVKIFEYISHGLPVVTTDCTEMASFVRENGFGVTSEDTPEALANSIGQLVSDENSLKLKGDNAVKTLQDGNRWIDRARTVSSQLTETVQRNTS